MQPKIVIRQMLKFMQEIVKFLGQVVSADGIETDPAKVEKVGTGQFQATPMSCDHLLRSLAITAGS